jgi:hypothetical protein
MQISKGISPLSLSFARARKCFFGGQNGNQRKPLVGRCASLFSVRKTLALWFISTGKISVVF